MRVWRISNYADLSGKGGMVSAGRWHPIKTPIVYCADHPASALLEILVHVDLEDAAPTYQLIGIEVPDDVPIETPELVDDRANDTPTTQRIGSQFIKTKRAAALRVPSVIVPFAWNYLLNPVMTDAVGIRIVSITNHPVDRRLIEPPTS